MKKILITLLVASLNVNLAYAKGDCNANAGPGVNWSGCNKDSEIWNHVDLSGANLSYTDCVLCSFIGATLDGITANNSDLSGSSFENASLINANLATANLSASSMEGTNLESANLQGANLTGVPLAGANLNSANLKGAKIDTSTLTTQFSGVTLEHAIWVNGNECKGLNSQVTDSFTGC